MTGALILNCLNYFYAVMAYIKFGVKTPELQVTSRAMYFFFLLSFSNKGVVHRRYKDVLLLWPDSIFVCLDFCAFATAHVLNRILLYHFWGLLIYACCCCVHKVWYIYFFISLVCVFEHWIENLIKILIWMLGSFMWIWLMSFLRIPLLFCFPDWIDCLSNSFNFSHVVTNNWGVSLNHISDGLLSKSLAIESVLLLVLDWDTV